MSIPTSVKAFLLTFIWVAILAIFFSEVEIQIEGAAGWGANLPTWRIEKHWLLDLFWGGRAMTGYHAWVFPFIAMFFHFPFFFGETWTLKLQARVIACIIEFWILEDFLWFVLNPAFGIERFNPDIVKWHHNWMWGTPIDYWIGGAVAVFLFVYSFRELNQKSLSAFK